jgi:hypothetical protein
MVPIREAFLLALPLELAMLGGMVYLWAARRRSPRAAGWGIGGLAGMLALHGIGCLVLLVPTRSWPILLGQSIPAHHNTILGLSVLIFGLQGVALLILVRAVMADRPATPDAD